MDYHQEEEEEERINFLRIIAAFKCYRTSSNMRIDTKEAYVNTLSEKHQKFLFFHKNHLNLIRSCIDGNSKVIKKIIEDSECIFEHENEATNYPKTTNGEIARIHSHDIEKVQITLKQFARDWSTEGQEERSQCYKPIIDEVMNFFCNQNNLDDPNYDIGTVKILVPGAGLGRLTYELAYRGFYCEGNEFSLYMLIASNFILNRCLIENQYTIYPWIHQHVNTLRREDQVHPVKIPDVSPTQAPPKGTMNMVAGDFLQVYREHNHWDCVATCFFIDCASNIIQFIELIYNILKPGGIWVNLGPLLYHFCDVIDESSIEPTYEDLISIITGVGFKIMKNETNVETKYAQNPRSMQQSHYNSIFLVCQKTVTNNENGEYFEDLVI